ncbi:hypothetical protein [Legionella gresilensis]|uniref:hypothetical protein n=1 Tax=Legionella gresilensis TaxID=91823 RepID=UPI0010416243|nr:hypothetical protein [Legionella gresilensis]
MHEQSSIKKEEKSTLKCQVELNCLSQIEAILSRNLKDKQLKEPKVVADCKQDLVKFTSETYESNLKEILKKIEEHSYNLGIGGGSEGYSHSAFRIRNIIKEALDDVNKGKLISHSKYSRIAFDVECELTGKLKVTKGVTFFGWGKRTASTVNLYNDILTSFFPIIKLQHASKPPMEKSYKDTGYHIDETKFTKG